MSNPVQFDEESEGTATIAKPAQCSFTTGPAGSGKTYQFKRRIELDEDEGVLCATTGVAAINLGTVTLNSLLGFFDTEDLADKVAQPGSPVVRKLISLRKVEGKRSLMIDEASMLNAYTLDVITLAVEMANVRMGDKEIKVELTGDFAQLPPVQGEWAFKGNKWNLYAQNVTKLTKIYRQTDEKFLAALGHARKGEGREAADILTNIAKFTSGVDLNFNGTTIVAKNADVDKINQLRYLKVMGKEMRYRSQRWGQQRSEWKNVPEEMYLKNESYVMILANGYTDPVLTGKKELIYANGDGGTIVEMGGSGVTVLLDRTGEAVEIPYVIRTFESKEQPDKSKWVESYFDEAKKKWISGAVTYLPVRLGYAVTVHKSQGLTLDRVQIDPRGHFFGSPNMAYVALSRARTAQGLKIIGNADLLARRINVDKEIGEWI